MSFGKDSKNHGVKKSAGIGQTAFLGVGSTVVGKIVFSGPATLSGRVEGEIKAEQRLEVGEGAVIHAKIEGSEVIVKGTVEGDIIATSKLLLLQPGKVIGNVSCGSLHVEDGAVFEGTCKMLRKSGSSSSAGSSTGAGSGASSVSTSSTVTKS